MIDLGIQFKIRECRGAALNFRAYLHAKIVGKKTGTRPSGLNMLAQVYVKERRRVKIQIHMRHGTLLEFNRRAASRSGLQPPGPYIGGNTLTCAGRRAPLGPAQG
eukprot:1138662-Pelagomonas_calceolata.AAC.7